MYALLMLAALGQSCAGVGVGVGVAQYGAQAVAVGANYNAGAAFAAQPYAGLQQVRVVQRVVQPVAVQAVVAQPVYVGASSYNAGAVAVIQARPVVRQRVVTRTRTVTSTGGGGLFGRILGR